LTNCPQRLEIAKQDHQVGQVSSLKTGLLHIDEAMLRGHQNGDHSSGVQICEQFVKVHDKGTVTAHGLQISVQTINDHHPSMVFFYACADVVNALPGSYVRGIDALQFHEAPLDVLC